MRAWTLIRNEAIKTRHRRAFWVSLLSFLAIVAMAMGEQFYGAMTDPERSFTLPEAWSGALGSLGPLPGLFGAVALILLIASEFTWKTSRQNVIDGLSKDEFFLGKLLAYPPVVLSFLALLLGVTGVLAFISTDRAAATEPLIRGVDLAHMGGVALTVLGYTSIAFFCAFLARSTGAAMGLFFLYVAFIEQLLGGLLARVAEWGEAATGYLPRTVFDSLFDVRQFDLEARQAYVDRLLADGRTPPEYMETPLLAGLALAWIAVFVAAAYGAYRRRDL